MDEGGAGSDTAEEGPTPAPSVKEKRKQSAGEESGGRGNKRVASAGGGTDAAGNGRAREEEEAVVAPAGKKQKTGGCSIEDAGDGMEDRILKEAVVVAPATKQQKTVGCGIQDAGDGMEDRILKEAAVAAANNKSKYRVPPTEEVQQKAKKRRGLKADGSGDPGHNRKHAKSSDASEVVVAYTSNMLGRYGYLLRLMTHLLPYKNQGKAYECSLNRIQALIKWSRCSQCLFFQWLHKDQKMICWIFNTTRRSCVKFLVNPAFSTEMLEVKVKRATCSFSLNFCSDETWTGVKEVLEMMFCPQDESSADAPDNVYVSTRIDDCVYFRNMKIEKLPDIADGEALVLKGVGPNFCLKLVGIHREGDAPHLASVVSHDQVKTELIVRPIVYYSLSPELGSHTAVHSLWLNGEKYLILLESGSDLSMFEGYNINLQEFLEEQSFLKTKHIVGSKSDERSLFTRNIGKSIIRSILAYFVELFSCQKCIGMVTIKFKHILLKESSVQLYGVEVVDYEENQAKQNIVQIVGLIQRCFPPGLIPCDLESMLHILVQDPLHNLHAAKDDSSLLSAKERRELLVYLHTEYMTNVKPKLLAGGDGKQQVDNFFKDCPYLYTWDDTMGRNTYLTDVANRNALLGTRKLEKRKVEERKKKEQENKKKAEKERKKKEEEEERKGGEVDRHVGEMGELQFHVMTNCDMHIYESATKDGITPFRLSWTDYIRTFYFRMYLSFVQRRMAQYMKTVSDESTVDVDGVRCREDEEEIARAITSGQLSRDGKQMRQ